jgi:hypothetical protein
MDMQRVPTPAERAELAELLVRYDEALKPAAPHEIEQQIRILSCMFPVAKITPEEAEMRIAGYVVALSEVPLDVLIGAQVKAVRKHTFMPSAKELLDLCGELEVRRFRRFRVNYLILKHDREYRPPAEDRPLTDAERKELDDILRRLDAAA